MSLIYLYVPLQRPVLQHGGGVPDEEPFHALSPDFLLQPLGAVGNAGGPSLVVMAVRGHKIRQALPDDFPGSRLSRVTGFPGKGGRVYLK